MSERIIDLRELYRAGIGNDVFRVLLMNCTNGPEKQDSGYSNKLDINGWVNLFADIIPITDSQLKVFFRYMEIYHDEYFVRVANANNEHDHAVAKKLRYINREAHFEFEMAILYAFEIC